MNVRVTAASQDIVTEIRAVTAALAVVDSLELVGGVTSIRVIVK